MATGNAVVFVAVVPCFHTLYSLTSIYILIVKNINSQDPASQLTHGFDPQHVTPTGNTTQPDS